MISSHSANTEIPIIEYDISKITKPMEIKLLQNIIANTCLKNGKQLDELDLEITCPLSIPRDHNSPISQILTQPNTKLWTILDITAQQRGVALTKLMVAEPRSKYVEIWQVHKKTIDFVAIVPGKRLVQKPFQQKIFPGSDSANFSSIITKQLVREKDRKITKISTQIMPLNSYLLNLKKLNRKSAKTDDVKLEIRIALARKFCKDAVANHMAALEQFKKACKKELVDAATALTDKLSRFTGIKPDSDEMDEIENDTDKIDEIENDVAQIIPQNIMAKYRSKKREIRRLIKEGNMKIDKLKDSRKRYKNLAIEQAEQNAKLREQVEKYQQIIIQGLISTGQQNMTCMPQKRGTNHKWKGQFVRDRSEVITPKDAKSVCEQTLCILTIFEKMHEKFMDSSTVAMRARINQEINYLAKTTKTTRHTQKISERILSTIFSYLETGELTGGTLKSPQATLLKDFWAANLQIGTFEQKLAQAEKAAAKLQQEIAQINEFTNWSRYTDTAYQLTGLDRPD